MTEREQQDEQDLHVINNSMKVLAEIAALPEHDEFALLRAHAHAHAVNQACNAIMARIEADKLIERVKL